LAGAVVGALLKMIDNLLCDNIIHYSW